jgi:hypothetical protein
MTAKSRATLKQQFATGDVPTGADYADLIDSFFNIIDTTAQSVVSEMVFTTVSGATGRFSSAVAIGTAAAAGAGLTVQSSDQASALKFDTPTTAIASGGGGGAVPTSAAGFLIAVVSGVASFIPYFRHK